MPPVALLDAVLGIDLGSTSLRAYIWCPSTSTAHYVENKTWNNPDIFRREKSDYSTIGYPFGDGKEVYIGDTLDPERIPTSLKFAFYVLADASDELIEQYPLVKPLLDQKDDKAFQQRLYQGLVALLSTIQTRVSGMCKTNKLKITAIGLSIPSQWNLDFEDVYQDLVSHVFNFPPSEIYFCTETEALAHCLFRHHLDELQGGGSHDALLFLDFGGHNMNGCLFNIVYGHDGTPNFYRIGDSFGAGGGSEQWEFNVGMHCEQYFKNLEGFGSLPPKQKQCLLDGFNREKTKLGPGNSDVVTLCTFRNGKPWVIFLDPDVIDNCWKDALRGPLEVAANEIARLSEIKGLSLRVVVSGGTSKNPAVQSRIRQMCADASVREPFFTDRLDVYYGTAKIAKGAAYAASNCRTVTDFFQAGAAFGVQVKEGNHNAGNQWNNIALFHLDENRQESVPFDLTGRDELKIVCDPFWSTSKTKTEDDTLRFDKCYDILPLGKLKRGTWSFKLSLTGPRDSRSLSIERWRKRYRKGARPKLLDTTSLPLQFDRGTNCVYVGVRGRSLDELNLIKWQETANNENPATSTSGAILLQNRNHNIISDTGDSDDYDIPSPSAERVQSRHRFMLLNSNVRSSRMQSGILPVTQPRFKPTGSLRSKENARVDFHSPGKPCT